MPTAVPKWLLPMIAGLAIVGGGVAAAAIGDDPSTSDPVPEVTTSTTAVPDGDAPDATDEQPADDDGTDAVERYWGPECGDGPVTNHGQYVSQATKGGASRSGAAHSPCGKPLSSVDVTTTVATLPPGDGDGVIPEDPATGSSSNRGHGGGNGGHGGGPPPGKGGPKHA